MSFFYNFFISIFKYFNFGIFRCSNIIFKGYFIYIFRSCFRNFVNIIVIKIFSLIYWLGRFKIKIFWIIIDILVFLVIKN